MGMFPDDRAVQRFVGITEILEENDSPPRSSVVDEMRKQNETCPL